MCVYVRERKRKRDRIQPRVWASTLACSKYSCSCGVRGDGVSLMLLFFSSLA